MTELDDEGTDGQHPLRRSTDRYVRHSGFWLRVASGMLGMLGVCFALWAGVVWRAVDLTQQTMHELNASMREVRLHIKFMEETASMRSMQLERHALEPWHGEAGRELTKMKSQIEAIEKRPQSFRPSDNVP